MQKKNFQLIISDEAFDRAHFHQEIELLYILEGSLDVTVEKRTSHLRAEDLFIINSNREHSFKTHQNTLMVRFLVSYQLVADASGNGDVLFWCDSSVSESGRYQELRELLRGMIRRYVGSRGYTSSFGFLAESYAILENLTANFLMNIEPSGSSENGRRYDERLRQINSYINNNYDQQISMKELSEKLYLSNGYLSRFFKKNYGMNFAGYLTNIRLFHAADDLLYTDEPVTRIAYNNGFTSAALFNKIFKKQNGMTPTEFRKKNQEKTVKRDHPHREILEKRLEKIVEPGPQEPGEDGTAAVSAGGVYQAGRYSPLKNSWAKLINFGAASNLLHSSVREHIIILKQALDFEYVRFWGLFTEEFFIRPDQEEYNFSQIDSVLDFVLEQGLKPHIELGLKPDVLLEGVGSARYRSRHLMDAYTAESWGRLMKAFMRHLGQRYGQDALDDWRMELWYDEDWRLDPANDERYFAFFRATREAVKACNENILLGGYGIRMDSGSGRREKFLRDWNQREERPDYLSIMYYAYERGVDGLDQYAKRSTDNDSFIHLFSREKQLIENAGLGGIPLVISEWNLTPSVRNYINDTTFKGAYIIKNIIDLYGMADVMGYGAGSDRQYSSFDTAELLFGGTGLVTRDAIMKPAAFAFDFLNRLYPYCIGRDGSCLITTDRHDNYGIVCHNQQVLGYSYYLTDEREIDKASVWKYFEGNRKLKLRIRLEGVTEGPYRIKIYRINEQNGSVLKIWGDLDYEKEPSRNDIKYLRRVCEPGMTIRTAESKDRELVVEEELMPNEIAFISVRCSL